MNKNIKNTTKMEIAKLNTLKSKFENQNSYERRDVLQYAMYNTNNIGGCVIVA